MNGSPDPLPELATFLKPFAPVFRRTTSRKSLERYVTGLLTDLSRKKCEAIAQTMANTSLEQLQHLLTNTAWDPWPWMNSTCAPWSSAAPGKECWYSTK